MEQSHNPPGRTVQAAPTSELSSGMLREKRRRNRKINSCDECRRRKMKCSRTQPCHPCQIFSRKCVYASANTIKSGAPSSSPSPADSSAPDTHGLGKLSLPSSSSGYVSRLNFRKDAQHDGMGPPPSQRSATDMCLRIGKLSSTERIGGIPRPDIVAKLDSLLTRHGANGQHCKSHDPFQAPIQAWFKPHEQLPLGILLSTELGIPFDDSGFPSQLQYRALFRQYFTAVDPIAHLVPEKHFYQEIESYWTTSISEREALQSRQALMLTVCYAAAISLPLLQSQNLFSMPKEALVRRLKTATEKSLSCADIFGSPKLETIQAVIIYLMPQCRSEVSQSHSIFLGALVRQAQLIGLHHDPGRQGFRTVESQMRRHLWHQLSFLDLRTAEAAGPVAALLSDSFDVKLPYNINDDCIWALDSVTSPTLQEQKWTASTLSLIRYECYEVHRLIFREREKIKNGLSTLSSVMAIVEEHKQRIQTKYLSYLDEGAPLQRYAMVVGRLLTARFEGMLLHSQIPETDRSGAHLELRDRVIRSCLEIVEAGAVLETDPELAPWAWYASTYQQYHSLIFLLVEIYRTPGLPEADRILAMANYVFGTPLGADSGAICGEFLHVLKDHLQSFLEARGISYLVRPPSSRPDRQPDERVPDSPGFQIMDHEIMAWSDINLTNETLNTGDGGGFDESGFWWPWPLPEFDQADEQQ